MNKEDIIRMAREAGMPPVEIISDKPVLYPVPDAIERFANLVAVAERQRQQLTDEQISDLWHQSGEQPFKFARMLLK